MARGFLLVLVLLVGVAVATPNTITITVTDLTGVWSAPVNLTLYALGDANNNTQLVGFLSRLQPTLRAQLVIVGTSGTGSNEYMGAAYNFSIPSTQLLSLFMYNLGTVFTASTPTILTSTVQQLSSTSFQLGVFASSPLIEFCLAQTPSYLPGFAIPGVTTWLSGLASPATDCGDVALSLSYAWTYTGGTYIDTNTTISATANFTTPALASTVFWLAFNKTRPVTLNLQVTVGGPLNPINHNIQLTRYPNGTLVATNIYSPLITGFSLSTLSLNGVATPSSISTAASYAPSEYQQQGGALVPALSANVALLSTNCATFLAPNGSVFSIQSTALNTFLASLPPNYFTYCTLGVQVTDPRFNTTSVYYTHIDIASNATVGPNGIVALSQTPFSGTVGSPYLVGGFAMFVGGASGVSIDTSNCARETTPYTYSQFNSGLPASSGWTPSLMLQEVCQNVPWSGCTNYTACNGPIITATCSYCNGGTVPFELEGPCYTNSSGTCTPNWGLFWAIEVSQLNATAICSAFGPNNTFTLVVNVTAQTTLGSTFFKQFSFTSTNVVSSYMNCTLDLINPSARRRRDLSQEEESGVRTRHRRSNEFSSGLLYFSIGISGTALNVNIPPSVIAAAEALNTSLVIADLSALFPGTNATTLAELAAVLISQYLPPPTTPPPTAASASGSGSSNPWEQHFIVVAASLGSFLGAVLLVVIIVLVVVCRKPRVVYGDTPLSSLFASK
jgi:hypothetical protein